MRERGLVSEHGHGHGHVRPSLSVDELRRMLADLGVEVCMEHAPGEPERDVAGLLAGLMAAVQWHLQGRDAQADQVDLSYHVMRSHLGFPACSCGSPYDGQAAVVASGL